MRWSQISPKVLSSVLPSCCILLMISRSNVYRSVFNFYSDDTTVCGCTSKHKDVTSLEDYVCSDLPLTNQSRRSDLKLSITKFISFQKHCSHFGVSPCNDESLHSQWSFMLCTSIGLQIQSILQLELIYIQATSKNPGKMVSSFHRSRK